MSATSKNNEVFLFMIIMVTLLISCDRNQNILFQDNNLMLESYSINMDCLIPCNNRYSDYTGNDRCYIDSCNLQTIMIAYIKDETILSSYLNSDLERMKNLNITYSVPIDNVISKHKIDIKKLKYQFYVEPYTITQEMDRNTRVSYVTYSNFFIDKKGSYQIEVRKIISEYNMINDLNWSKDFIDLEVEW